MSIKEKIDNAQPTTWLTDGIPKWKVRLIVWWAKTKARIILFWQRTRDKYGKSYVR